MKVGANSLAIGVRRTTVRKASGIHTCFTVNGSHDLGKYTDGADYLPSHQGMFLLVRDSSCTRGETGDWSSPPQIWLDHLGDENLVCGLYCSRELCRSVLRNCLTCTSIHHPSTCSVPMPCTIFQMATGAGKSDSALSGGLRAFWTPFSTPNFAHDHHDASRCRGRESNALAASFALAFRQEVFASLDVSYTAAATLSPSRRCRVNGALLDERLLVTGLAPSLQMNLRAEPCEKLYATDASPCARPLRGRDVLVQDVFDGYLRVRDIHGLEELLNHGLHELGHLCVQYLRTCSASRNLRSGQARTLISDLKRYVLLASPASSMVGVAGMVAEWILLDERLIFQSAS